MSSDIIENFEECEGMHQLQADPRAVAAGLLDFKSASSGGCPNEDPQLTDAGIEGGEAH